MLILTVGVMLCLLSPTLCLFSRKPRCLKINCHVDIIFLHCISSNQWMCTFSRSPRWHVLTSSHFLPHSLLFSYICTRVLGFLCVPFWWPSIPLLYLCSVSSVVVSHYQFVLYCALFPDTLSSSFGTYFWLSCCFRVAPYV